MLPHSLLSSRRLYEPDITVPATEKKTEAQRDLMTVPVIWLVSHEDIEQIGASLSLSFRL